MKSIVTIAACIILTSCNFKQRPEDVYRDKMKTATDEELMNEIIGKPLAYEVVNYDYTAQTKSKKDNTTIWSSSQMNSYPKFRYAQTGGLLGTTKEDGDKLGYETLGINSGAVLNVIFTKGSVYIDNFGRLNGNYELGRYANQDGTIKITFGDKYSPPSHLRAPTMNGSDFIVLSDLDKIRDNPVRECEFIGVKYYQTKTDGGKVLVHYYLKSLTRPGYFQKQSNAE